MIRIRAVTGALALLLLTTACGPAGGNAGAPSNALPHTGGTLTFDTDSDPGCLDPQQSPLAASQLISRPVVDSLVSQDPKTLQIRPWLATSWTVSPDATRFTFQLRDGVTFSDGTPFNGAAVKANLDRIVAPATKSLLAASLLAGYQGTQVNGQSVTVTFGKPDAPFLQAASTAFLGMLSPTAFAAGPQAMCDKPVGSGPFVVTGHVPQQSVTLGKRAGYGWGPPGARHQGAAYLDKVTVNVVGENGVRVGSLRTGQVDAIANVPPADVDGLKGFQLLSKAQPGIAYSIGINATRAPWTDVRLRQAFAKAVDTNEIVNTIYRGRYPRATSVLTPATPGYVNALPTSQFDPAAANKLLDEAGWTKDASGMRSRDGQPLTIDWTYISPAREQRDLVAQLVQQQLKQVGIDVKLTPLPAGEVTSRMVQGNWQLSDISFVRADGDVLRTVLTSPQSGFPVTQAPQVPSLLADATTTTDAGRRDADYAQAQRLIVQQAASIPIYDPTYLLGANNAVHDLTFDPQGLPSFYDAWLAR
jgi:peptide/nickel transport system substrate-binding protein